MEIWCDLWKNSTTCLVVDFLSDLPNKDSGNKYGENKQKYDDRSLIKKAIVQTI